MSKNNNRHSNQKPKAAEDASQEEVNETITETRGETTVNTPVDESPLAPEDKSADDVEELDETIEETDEDEDDKSEDNPTTQPPASSGPKVSVSSHLPNQRNTATVGDFSQAHVDSVIKPTKRFIEIAKDPEASVNQFNDTKSIMFTALMSAMKYPDVANFMATMNAFLALVKEHRETAFHEMEFNKYSHALTLSKSSCRDLPRVMCVFMTLASDESKNIGKLIDFRSVFTTALDERYIDRFRNWAMRQA